MAGDLEPADRVELTLPETGVCGGAGRSDGPATESADGVSGCRAPAPSPIRTGTGAPATAEQPAGGCCG